MTKTMISLRIPDDLLERMEKDAERRKRSRAFIAIEAIEKYYDNSHAESISRALHVKRTKKAGAR